MTPSAPTANSWKKTPSPLPSDPCGALAFAPPCPPTSTRERVNTMSEQPPKQHDLSPLHTLIRRAGLRLRTQQILNDVTTSLWIGLFCASLVLALHKANTLHEPNLWFALSALSPLLGLVRALLRPQDPIAVAARLDEVHGFKDRLASALQFSKLPSQSPFVLAQLQDTLARISSIDPKKIHQFHAPPDLAALPIFTTSLFILAFVSFPLPPPPQPEITTSQTVSTPDPNNDPTKIPEEPKIIFTLLDTNTAALKNNQIDDIIEALKDSDNQELKDAAKEIKDLLEADQAGLVSAGELDTKLTQLSQKMAAADNNCKGVDPSALFTQITPLSPLFGDNADTQNIRSLISADQNSKASAALTVLANRAIKTKKTNGFTDEAFLAAVDKARMTHLFCARQETAAVDDVLRDAADIFGDNAITKPVEQALKNGDMDAAAKALEKIAQQVAEKQFKEQDLEALASLLEKFSDFIDPNDPDIKKLIEKHRSSIKNLESKMKKAGGKLNAADKKKLDDANNELKRLTQPDDKKGDGPGAQKDLQDLTQKAREAADMLRNQGKPEPKPSSDPTAQPTPPKPSDDPGAQPKPSNDPAAQATPPSDPGSQPQPSTDPQNPPQQAPPPNKQSENLADKLRDIDQQKKEQQAQEQMRDMSERLREEARRSKGETRPSDQQAQSEQMKDFLDRAQGKKPGDPQNKGDQSDPKSAQDKTGGSGPQKSPGPGGQDPPADPTSKGQGDAKSGGQKTDQDDPTAKTTDASNGGPASDKRTGNNSKNAGSKDGKGEDLKANTEDFSIGGVDGGQGPTEPTSDIIKDASHSGFASTAYKELHAEYTRYKEEAMDREKVPPGYRHYINRYFDYIGPQQGARTATDANASPSDVSPTTPSIPQ